MKQWIVICIFSVSTLLAQKKIELVHNFTSNVQDQKIFEIPVDWRWSEQPLFYRIKQLADIQIHASDLSEFLTKKSKKQVLALSGNTDWFVFWNIPMHLKRSSISKLPKKKMILFMWEPPTVEPNLYKEKIQRLFSKIYTWNDDLVDNQHFFKFHYPVLNAMISDRPSFEEKKLCTTIIGHRTSKHPKELYSEREKAILYFNSLDNDDFEFYGRDWEDCGYSSYRGVVDDKIETMKYYRFALCYENIGGIKGYITEKIFDCFSAGCIPIYLGAENIQHYIPKNCFIDRREFADEAALYHFIKKMPEEEYEKRIESIKNYLDSEEASVFSRENFLKVFKTALELKI